MVNRKVRLRELCVCTVDRCGWHVNGLNLYVGHSDKSCA